MTTHYDENEIKFMIMEPKEDERYHTYSLQLLHEFKRLDIHIHFYKIYQDSILPKLLRLSKNYLKID